MMGYTLTVKKGRYRGTLIKKYEEENPKSLWSIKEKRQSSAINALKLKMSNTGLTIEQEAKVEEETKKTKKASAAAKEANLSELRKTTHQSIQSK